MSSLRVFLSHSHKDSSWCDVFVAELKNNGLDVWYDKEGLYVGSQWVKKLEQELQDRDTYLIVLTPDSWASQWVQSELGLALGQRKQIIGVLHKPTQVSGFITSYQLLDAIGLAPRQAAQVVAASLSGAKPAASPQAPSLQAAQVAAGTSDIDVSGEWEDEDKSFKLFLSQTGASITGTGRGGASFNITGSIKGYSLKLKGITSMPKSSYVSSYEINLTFVPPRKMGGHYAAYGGGNFFSKGSVRYSGSLTLFRKSH